MRALRRARREASSLLPYLATPTPAPPHKGEGKEGKALRALFALVLPVIDQIVDHGGIGQRGSVAEIAVLVLGDLAQDAAHDFSRARLRQARGESDEMGRLRQRR